MTLQWLIWIVAGFCLTHVRAQQSACQGAFVASFYQCVSNRSMDRDNFQWLVRNGQSGSPPADVQALTQQVCLEKQGLILCVKSVLTKILTLPVTQCPQTQKDGVVTLAREVLKSVNKKCEDPCRTTFKQSLERCFTDQNFRSPDFLIFNMTSPRDAIMGTNRAEVDRFCQTRNDITRCLRLAALKCVDSRVLLRSYGLDLDSLDFTYTILCNSSMVYMDSTECYRNPTPAVLQCRNVMATNMVILENQLADMNITESDYRDQLCVQRANQVQCETNALVQQNNAIKCNNVVVGLHRQEECSLFPLECSISNQNAAYSLCQVTDFRLPDRQFYRSSGSNAVFGAGFIVMTVSVAIFSVF